MCSIVKINIHFKIHNPHKSISEYTSRLNWIVRKKKHIPTAIKTELQGKLFKFFYLKRVIIYQDILDVNEFQEIYETRIPSIYGKKHTRI